MSFHAEELNKIRKATSGLFSGKARTLIAQDLSANAPLILDGMLRSPDERRGKLLPLLNAYTEKRQDALRRGASSYKDPQWATAAACETWLQAVLGNEDSAFEEILPIVGHLIARAHKSSVTKHEAALAARAIVWEHFKSENQNSCLFETADALISKEFESAFRKPQASVGDKALILLQALHFALYHEDSIREHIKSMSAYSRGAKQGMYMSFSPRIAQYMEDTPYLSKFKKK